MKYKFIIIGLALSVLLFPNLTVAAQYHNEEALQKKANEINDLIMCPLCAEPSHNPVTKPAVRCGIWS
jgi:hypothetical protein